ncbi:MAG: hypothetical protein KME46_27595 [Brasilonema angustatum HA4187-MV1]|jgi:hypothetical protein|nr:hypothetical protein [Brasilonema angustatum HA4187-MV1]
MEITKKLDELIDLLNAIRPLFLDTENLEYLDDKSAYEFGCDLGKRLAQEEYVPTLQQATELYHSGFISKLGADIETLIYVCTNTLQESTPGVNFSVKSFEIHVRASARVAAYYAVIQLYLRHPSVTSEKIIAKLGQKFYDSLMKAIGSALSLKYVQQYIHAWNILNWIEETAKKVEDKVSFSVLKDANKINRIIDIAKCEQFEIKAALVIAGKYEKEFNPLAELQYTIDTINAEIAQAEKDYNLKKAAELKYGKLTYLQRKLVIYGDELKIKVSQELTEFALKQTDYLQYSECLINLNKTESLESVNELEKTKNNKSELILPNKKILQHENMFIDLQQYLSGLCDVPLDNITLESTVFLGDYTSLKPISSGFWGSFSTREYSERYDAPDNSLGMDVLDGAELIIFIEGEFDIDISDNYYGKIMTIEELINIIIKLRCEGN